MMKPNRLSSGSAVIDKLLEGGYEKDIITTVYGPAGSGKTTMAMLCCIAAAKENKKAIFIDTEGGFSAERFRQLSGGSGEVLKNVLVMKPMNFAEQGRTIQNFNKNILDGRLKNIGLMVLDTVSMLYRVEVGKNREIRQVNNELGLQLSLLTEIARKKNIPVLITNQVYADFEQQDRVKMVGGDILRYSSKCLIELLKFKTMRKAVLIKHRSLPENKEAAFKIVEEGFEESSS